MELESLYKAYKLSRKHNRRSEDMVAFELDLYANLVSLCERINARSYAPLHNYSFMHRRSGNPREVFAAEPELKTMMSYSISRIMPLVDARLSKRTFNNRISMGSHAAVNRLIQDMYEVSEGGTKPCWIIKMDYKGYFPSMVRDHAWKLIRDVVDSGYRRDDKDDVLYCLYLGCFCDPRNSRRKSPIWDWADYPTYKSVYLRPDGVGGFIGFTEWQMMANLYPSEVIGWIEENISKHFVVYVDDIVIVTNNEESTLAQIPEFRRRLSDIGITLHPKKFYCQPAEHGTEFLGYKVFSDRIHIKRRIFERAMSVARSHDRGNRSYCDAINSYLGMIKSTSDLHLAKKLLDAVNRRGITKDYNNYKILIKSKQS